MGSSCSSTQKKDKERTKKKKKGLSPEGRRRSSVRSTDSLPYGKESTPPPTKAEHAAAPNLPPVDTSFREVQQNGGPLTSPTPQVTSPAAGSESMSEVGLPNIQNLPEEIQALLFGRLTEPPLTVPSHLISVYICSGFPDMQLERSCLMEKVFPELRTFCAERGYELNIADLHWGIASDCLDRHTFRNLCLDTITHLQEQGRLLVLVLLNEKLETALPHVLPFHIPCADFTTTVEAMSSADVKELFFKWYAVDENSVPACYALQPITEYFPDVESTDLEKRNKAENLWRQEMAQMTDALKSVLSLEKRTALLISVLEEEVQSAVTSENQRGHRCLWLERRYTHRGPQRSGSLAAENTETQSQIQPMVDTSDSKRYNLLRAQLEDHLPEAQKLVVRVKWSQDGINPVENKEHEQYVEEVCGSIFKELKTMIETIMEEDVNDEANQQCRGIEYQLFLELTQQMRQCYSHTRSFIGMDGSLNTIKQYLTGSARYPLIVHGSTGCGKTTLIARVVQKCEEWLPEVPVVVRLIGTSPNSSTQQQLLRSVCEQCCALYGMHPILASQSLDDHKASLEVLLGKVSAQRPLIILLDGLDQVVEYSSKHFDWLPTELPEYVKLVLTVSDGTQEFLELKEKFKEQNECFLSVNSWAAADYFKILKTSLERHDKKLSEGQEEVVNLCLQGATSPLYVSLIAEQATQWRSSKSPDEINVKRTLEDLVSKILLMLEKQVGSKALMFILGLLASARYGLSDAELLDILSCEDSVLNSIMIESETSVKRCPYTVWALTKKGLRSFLKTQVVGVHVLNTWRNATFWTLCTNSVKSEVMHSCTLALVDYFQSRWAINQKPCPSEVTGTEVLKSRYVLEQPLMFSTYPNRRKLDELPFYCIQLNRLAQQKLFSNAKWLVSKLLVSPNGPQDCLSNCNSGDTEYNEQLNHAVREKFFFSTEWLLCKVKGSDPYMLIEEMDMYLELNPSDTECKILRDLIQLASYSLRYDGTQFFSQIYSRLHKLMQSDGHAESYPNLKRLYSEACKPAISSLLPVTCYLQEPHAQKPATNEESEEGDSKPSFTFLYTIKENPAHMVSMSPDRNEIVVWNIFDESPVRRIIGVNQPRDIKMVDQFRALVLCNRELKVYSLDDGKLLVKLKGVMNQKMAYFGLHSEDYVVALSRNRMYVNMLNLTSGDLETTFKVGEDRFLNSLLVSANGKICVCGDETQKPFPLLVWDLANRKLLYDLRIPHHEFLTRLSAISSDGHYVVCVCRELNDSSPNFIIVYDLQSGTLFKKWKPERNSCSIAISSQGGCVVNGLDNCWVLIWDLSTGARRYTLRGHTAPVDQIRLDESGFRSLTYSSDGLDRSVRIWDVMKGECLAVFTPDEGFTCCELSLDGRAVVMGLEGQNKVFTHILCEGHTISEGIPEENIYGCVDNKDKIFDVSQSG